MRTEFGIVLCVSALGILLARLLWPCLLFMPWSWTVIAFVMILLLALVLHMTRWKCWAYLCQSRQRLHSTSMARQPLAYVTIGTSVTCVWSVFYGIVSHPCEMPWWPSVIAPALTLVFYTLVSSLSSNVNESIPGSSSSEPHIEVSERASSAFNDISSSSSSSKV